MPLRSFTNRLLPISAAVVLGLTLSACSSGMSLTQQKQRGYTISEDAVAQIRVGQSAALVTAVLGSPQVTNNFASETAWYYLGEKVQQTAFGMELNKERTLLVVYFDKKNKVVDTERLGIKDGKMFNIESRRTPSYGQDRTFLESILSSI
ncbi:outer membrane protein assembly factor BamE [Devosia sp. ZB163]|uniref:outer membrane protein assembly factor BamE n=1 Tax=Devosia sp. ZB163 TaxID=3025938 RepID=UPI002362903D|nr:outer membrane protein assembly factor BamE [Devosia sp. ZB163]MDC9824298.1 outer membrane protein assembly factor BamE [Devosia sp. ZB163]